MYALFGESEIDTSRAEEAEAMLKNGLAPQLKQVPGFVSATWGMSADGSRGRSFIVFSSEEAARAAKENVADRMPADAPVKIVSITPMEIIHQA